MSAEVKAQIARDLATLTRVTDFPVAPFAYGSDIRGTFDLDPTMREVSATSTLALAEALVRRLDTPRGSLPDDRNYGIDLRSYCNRGTTAADLRSLGGQVKSELSKDDRVDTVTVVVTPSLTGSSLALTIAVRPIDASIGPFTLTLSASDVGVLLEEIRST